MNLIVERGTAEIRKFRNKADHEILHNLLQSRPDATVTIRYNGECWIWSVVGGGKCAAGPADTLSEAAFLAVQYLQEKEAA